MLELGAMTEDATAPARARVDPTKLSRIGRPRQ